MIAKNNKKNTHKANMVSDCHIAWELIDSLMPLSKPDQRLLDEHLKVCPNCAAEAVIEQSLREIVAPHHNLPSPSLGFEKALMDELGLTPVPKPEYKPIAAWSWALGGLAALVAIAFIYWDTLVKHTYKCVRFLLLNLADITVKLDATFTDAVSNSVGKLDGYLFTLLGEFARITINENLLIFNIMCASIVVISGLVAVGMVNRK